MSRTARELLLVLGWGALAAGCSALGLDRFEFDRCVDRRCAALNARDGIDEETACQLWQCDDAFVDCRFGARDMDHDGFVATGCSDGGIAGIDCEDDVPEAHPGASETCNGADDDCNGLVDDGATGAGRDAVVVSDAPLGTPPVAWIAGAPAAGGLTIATPTSGELYGALVAGIDPVESSADLPLVSDEGGAAISPESGCVTAIASPVVLPPSPCPCSGTEVCVVDGSGASICERPVLPRSPPRAGDCTAHWECDDGIACNGVETCEPSSTATGVDARGCRTAATPPCGDPLACDEATDSCIIERIDDCVTILDAALAPTDGREWIAAMVNSSGCPEGTLRFATFVTDASLDPTLTRYRPGFVARGPTYRSTVWRGVDADESCTGTSRGAGAPAGVAGVGLASLPSFGERFRAQALSAFLEAPACRTNGDCAAAAVGGSGPVDVDVLGVWLEESLLTGAVTSVPYVNAAGDGVPTRLSLRAAAGTTRVSVASFGAGAAAGYVVAYPADGGGIAVHVAPAMADPLPECPSPLPPDARCLSHAAPFNSVVLPTERRSTPALPAGTTARRFASGAAPAGDAVVVIRTNDDGTRAYFAWATATTVELGVAPLDVTTGTLGAEEMLGSFPSTGAGSFRALEVDSNIALAGPVVDGRAVEASGEGGVVIVWEDAAGTRGLRVSDHTGDVVGGAVTIGPATDAPTPFVGADGEIRVLGRDGADLIVFPTVCGS